MGSRGFGGGAGGELDEETKKNQNIMNIVREGQISLLVSGMASVSHHQQLLCLPPLITPPPPVTPPPAASPGS